MSYLDFAPFTPNDPTRSRSALASEAAFAMTLWGEARGESLQAKSVVASVILNRASKPSWMDGMLPLSTPLKDRVKAVCLQPKQFSCWNPSDPNSPKLWKPLDHDKLVVWQECVLIAAASLDGLFRNQVMGADHYHSFPADEKSHWPKWADDKKLVTRIGKFFLYDLEP